MVYLSHVVFIVTVFDSDSDWFKNDHLPDLVNRHNCCVRFCEVGIGRSTAIECALDRHVRGCTVDLTAQLGRDNVAGVFDKPHLPPAISMR